MSDQKKRIIIVEDSETTRFFYKVTLKKWGFDVLEAETGKEGWDIIQNEKPDLVVLDMMLPDTNGIEVLKNIRATESTKKTPVLILTSDKDIVHVQRALQLGANHYSVKGKDSLEKIKNMIEKLLQRTAEKNMQISNSSSA